MGRLANNLNKKKLKKIEPIAKKVMELEDSVSELSNSELKAKTTEFRERLENGETLDDILPEAFAVCREGAWRTLKMKPYYVQVLAGIALHQGNIAEAMTGEGKTLVATLPVYLNALEGKGVHVVTVNDYLSQRDAMNMGKLYSFLGLTIGCITQESKPHERKLAYNCDITYGANNEFGFDYLRDNMAKNTAQIVQRELNYAIVDEVDSILIDEARTPLIISTTAEDITDMYEKAEEFVKTLNKEDVDYEEKDRQVSLTDSGIKKCEEFFEIESLSDIDSMEINHHVLQALKAHYLMTKDIDYIVTEGLVEIVDEFTGRILYGRRFSDGLHQAIECKENVHINTDTKTLATVTFQNYFRMYKKLAGMTGTAKTEEEEFEEIYNLQVITIPTNRPIQRVDRPDAIYSTVKGKFNAVADRIIEIHETGQPVLVGTISVERSEALAKLLRQRGFEDFNVLNAKNHTEEAKIIADAGKLGAVTISTNMAGRGTDIMLGGNPEFKALDEMEKNGYTPIELFYANNIMETDDEKLLAAREKYNELYNKYNETCSKEYDEVIALGGLYIIGTDRHDSRRIDNQLRGRAGRQGDVGETQFFVSVEDDLLRLFGGERLEKYIAKMDFREDEVIESAMVSRRLDNAQKTVEGRNFGMRKNVIQYDDVMNVQRKVIYEERRKVLEGIDLSEEVVHMTRNVTDAIVEEITVVSKYPESWDFEKLYHKLREVSDKFEPFDFDEDEIYGLDEQKLKDVTYETFLDLYRKKEEELGPSGARIRERALLLRIVDDKWMTHLSDMTMLRNGIGLRGLGGQKPAAEYAREGLEMFNELTANIQYDFVKGCHQIVADRLIFKVQPIQVPKND